MKKISYLLSLLVVTGMLFVSCEGPEGPAGMDGATQCNACHNSGTSFSQKMVEFEESAHSIGTYYTRGGQCSGCHSTEGFLARMDFTAISEIDALAEEVQTPISCRACHHVHESYDETDWALTYTDQVTETLFGYKDGDTYSSVAFADYGDANMCLQCHQARDRGNVPAADATGEVTVSLHWGPHYGVQGNVLQASGGVHVTGSATYPGATEGHAALSGACMSCHMVDGDHTLEVAYSACATCHSSADNAEDLVSALHKEIDALKFELGATLAAAGAMTANVESEWVWNNTDSIHEMVVDTTGFSPVGGYGGAAISADLAKGVYNYMVVYQDHSYGVHNPSYIRALLNNSLAALK